MALQLSRSVFPRTQEAKPILKRLKSVRFWEISDSDFGGY
jgi:hypothetical protein